jgi:integrase
MRRFGFKPEALGPEGTTSRQKAAILYERWLQVKNLNPSEIKAATEPPRKTIDQICLAKKYPRGSIGEAWQKWIQSEPWNSLASSTRNKIWWEAWNKRIEPVFGDIDPNSVTMESLADWHATIIDVSGIDPAHKALKIWRAFWPVLKALRYTQLSDPSQKIRNKAPPARTQRFSHGEAMRLAKAAMRAGFRGLACIIVVAWDTGFSPQDCRTLRRRHLGLDPKTRRIILDRSLEGRGKTGVAVIGTLSPFGHWLVDRYLGELRAEHHTESFLFRMRTGVPYGQSRLGNDFARIRDQVFPGDKRQLRDMRRSGVMEAFTGGAEARDVSEKFGNSIDRSAFLFRTYNPVDLDKVRQTDVLRLEGRRRKNKSGA